MMQIGKIYNGNSGMWLRVRRDSRLGLDFTYFLVEISRLGIVSVSRNHFTEFSVSSRSRKTFLQNSRSRLSLEKRFIKNSRLVSSLGFSEKNFENREVSKKKSISKVLGSF